MPGGLTLLASANADIPTPAAGKVTIFFSLTDGVPSYKDDTGTVNPLGTTGATGAQGPIGPAIPFLFDQIQGEDGIPGPQGPAGSGSAGNGRLTGFQLFDTPGAFTYNATAGTSFVVMELLGAGAGGGGCISPTGSLTCVSPGGGPGAWLLKMLTVAEADGESGVIGALGAGGAAGANAGVNGGATTFTDASAVVYSAGGGTGGGTGAALAAPNASPGAVGGTPTNGDIQQPGWRATLGISATTAQVRGSQGGNSKYGSGGNAGNVTAVNTSSAGGNASGHGAGGGGAAAVGTGAAAAGGNGTDGMAIFWEYS